MADLASAAILISANKATLFENKGNGTIIFNTLATDLDQKDAQNAIIEALGGPPVLLALILASLVASFLLLAFEWRKVLPWPNNRYSSLIYKKAQRIIKSRDISYAFTSQVAYSYYTIRSYPHYCFFSQIQNSRKSVDVLAFWVFFKFRGWKRLILAEFPRQFLNALILYDIFKQYVNMILIPRTVRLFKMYKKCFQSGTRQSSYSSFYNASQSQSG
jgi:Fungal potassium channel